MVIDRYTDRRRGLRDSNRKTERNRNREIQEGFGDRDSCRGLRDRQTDIVGLRIDR